MAAILIPHKEQKQDAEVSTIITEAITTIEERLDQLEKRNKSLAAALTLMAVAMCAVVTMAATGKKNGDFHTVTARYILVKNEAGETAVGLGANHGNGRVTTYAAQGKRTVELMATDEGGRILVNNKTGEIIVNIQADEYGNGVVGAWNRKGKGRTLQPGP